MLYTSYLVQLVRIIGAYAQGRREGGRGLCLSPNRDIVTKKKIVDADSKYHVIEK